MIGIAATNITSPLGWSSEQNYLALKAGYSALKHYPSFGHIPTGVTVAAFTEEQRVAMALDGFTRFESLVIRSVREALSHTPVDLSSERTLFILSTTKGNVEELGADGDRNYSAPGAAAKKIAAQLGIVTEPVVVCNACISGVTAQLLAGRLLASGLYDTAIVCGADCLTDFTLAGFLSFKSLSPEECRPFDMERLGLNLGEAAATVIYTVSQTADAHPWRFVSASLNNDAYHLSAPSPSGEGLQRAIDSTLAAVGSGDIAFIGAHGTATMFNDQMESRAIEGAGLSSVPVSAIKGCYGHTLGAAGVLESVISMMALEDGIVLPVRGFSEIGVSGKMNISSQARPAAGQSFLKIISGFGGCNGAMLFTKGQGEYKPAPFTGTLNTRHSVHITPDSVTVDDETLGLSAKGDDILDALYRDFIADYPKFHKMDMLSKLVFAAAELMARREGPQEKDGERAVILFNSTSSVVQDRQHVGTICDVEGFFPSPSVFLYTLPNISTGEVAIRNSYKGETSLYILGDRNYGLMDNILRSSISGSPMRSVLTGWADYSDAGEFEAEMKIIEIQR